MDQKRIKTDQKNVIGDCMARIPIGHKDLTIIEVNRLHEK